MKNILFATALTLASFALHAQGYEVLPDNNGTKFLKGIITREVLEKDSAYAKQMTSRPDGYKPNPTALAALQKNVDSLQFIVFLGTWCEDSHYILPRFFALLDAAGFSRNRVSLVATDRNKKTLGNLSESLNVASVPTIIVLKHGKELGRVVEYGKSGLFDKDLGLILTAQ